MPRTDSWALGCLSCAPQPRPRSPFSPAKARACPHYTQSSHCITAHVSTSRSCLPHQVCPGSGGRVARRPLDHWGTSGVPQEEYGCNALDLLGASPRVPAAGRRKQLLGLGVRVELGQTYSQPASSSARPGWCCREVGALSPSVGVGWVGPLCGPPPHPVVPAVTVWRPLYSCRKERSPCSMASAHVVPVAHSCPAPAPSVVVGLFPEFRPWRRPRGRDARHTPTLQGRTRPVGAQVPGWGGLDGPGDTGPGKGRPGGRCGPLRSGLSGHGKGMWSPSIPSGPKPSNPSDR